MTKPPWDPELNLISSTNKYLHFNVGIYSFNLEIRYNLFWGSSCKMVLMF